MSEIHLKGLSYWKAVLTVAILIMTAIGLILGGGGIVATKLWGLTPIQRHTADIRRIEAKLNCALFDLPRGCRARLAPRRWELPRR